MLLSALPNLHPTSEQGTFLDKLVSLQPGIIFQNLASKDLTQFPKNTINAAFAPEYDVLKTVDTLPDSRVMAKVCPELFLIM